MKVTILGCGPAGLLAAQGAADAGAEVFIISQKQKSVIVGAQFIHAPIPRMRVSASSVTVHKRGTAEGYSKKVYGVEGVATSWGNYEDGEVLACWPMREVYERLWRRWAGKIIDRTVDTSLLAEVSNGAGGDLVVSTIPAPALCTNGHNFESSEIAVTISEVTSNHNTIIYNGDPKLKWTRASFLFGCLSLEYGTKVRRPGQKSNPLNARLVKKPQRTDCDCRPEIMRAGRYGKWQRGVLAHSAYEEVFGVVQQMS